LVRMNEHWYPKERYMFAISIPERVNVKKPSPNHTNWDVEVLENPEEVSLWLLAMKLVNDVDDLVIELKKIEVCFMPGPQFAGFGRLPDHVVTDLGKELVKSGEGKNRYEQAWKDWKNFRKIVEAVNADTVVGKRRRLGSN
jgi:hypothetical protein